MMTRLEISFCVFGLLLATSTLVQGQELPNEMPTCHRSNSDFNKCLASAIQKSIMFLGDGFKPLNIPSLDPYELGHAQSTHIGSGNANFNLKSEIWNASVVGLTTGLEVLRVASKFDKNFNLKVESFVPSLKLNANYSMTGQMLILPINGRGRMRMVQTNVSAVTIFKGDYFEKDGMKFVNITSFNMKLKPKKVTFNFENIFNGDKRLSDTINEFMNENWQEVNKILVPEYFGILYERFKAISNKIFTNIPIDAIFLN